MNQPSRFRRLLAGLVLAVTFALLATGCVDSSPAPSVEPQDDDVHVDAPVPAQFEEEQHSEVSPVDANPDPPAEPQDDDVEENPPVSVRFEEDWRSNPPQGVTAIFKGGNFRGSGFPAVSSDGASIALLYYGGRPPADAYPTFELWSTSPLQRLHQLVLLSDDEALSWGLASPAAIALVRDRINLVNQFLSERDYYPMEPFFDFSRPAWHERPIDTPDPASVPVEKWGVRLAYTIGEERVDDPRLRESNRLGIEGIESGRLLLEHEFPAIVLRSSDGNPMNDCIVQGRPAQGWYLPEHRIIVIRTINNGSGHYCDLADEWILRHLQENSVGGLP